MKSDTKKIIPNRRIDLKGEVCPYTFVKSKLAMEEMRLGEVLEVIVDHEPAVENVPKSMQNEGQRVLTVEKINGADWRMVFKKEIE
ncbi:MAG TPA: sulfurtransferase TusA family protein [Candidatus Avalokitesvara rifleensis]|uniref:sulfurtransferase TusA family protein n=1 Tax=Candidatus Avalokitesvara rifleensis TaxID=3367620 RepID=UPI002713C8D4|nr:sulfurtransferase TusA family protein [Candidatus Brocadiales bacterium]